MPLSEYEQRVLEQMERALTTDDPRLASTLQSPRRHSALRYVAAGVAVLVGLFLLVLGVALSRMWLGGIGFFLMFGGVVFAMQTPRSRSGAGGAAAKAGKGTKDPSAPRPPKAARKGFLNRLEERWDHRRDQGM